MIIFLCVLSIVIMSYGIGVLAQKSLSAKDVSKITAQRDKLFKEKQKLYGWVDGANFKKNEYLARAEKVESQRDELLVLMNEFCVRVENGEVRSEKTYSKFRAAIEKIEADK